MKKSIFTVIIVCFVILGFSTMGLADVAERVSRGAKKIGTGWVEIPREIVGCTEDNPIIGPFSGAAKGACNAFAKTASGVVDIISMFFVPQTDEEVVQPSMVE